jgi:hypothetical protein
MRIKWQKHRRWKSKGFTLAEALIATGLGATLFPALYAGFAFGFANVDSARCDVRATQILVKRAESIRLYTFSELTDPNYNPPTFTEQFDPRGQQAGTGGIVYSGTFSATMPPSGSIPNSYRTNMLLVTIGLTWHTGNIQHSRSLQTYVAANGMQSYVSKGQ